MRTTVKWSETTAGVDDVRPPIYSVCYSPNGNTIVAACGIRILIYDASTGDVVRSIKGHTDTVYSVVYSYDGKGFASGGADKTVIIWTSKGDGLLKYQHKESVQALSYNSLTGQLASISSSDYGIWSPEQSKVSKSSLPSKGLCASWSRDGQTLAIGLFDGTVLLITPGTMENIQFKRTAPVWTLSFLPLTENGMNVLVVGSWDRRLSFYNIHGKPLGKEKELLCDPCCISFYDNGELLLISGTDHKVMLYTKDGDMLVKVTEADDWVWSAQQRPGALQVCCGTNDGSITVLEISTPAVHSIYHDQYVYRDKLTYAVVHQLTLGKKLCISCNDYIRKLAICRDRLAVQLHDRFVIFGFFYDDQREMRFRELAHIRKSVECNILCVTFNYFIVCYDRRLTMYDFQGNKCREWAFESYVCYIKVIAGIEGKEALLLGLKDGVGLRVFIDNPFSTTLVKVNASIRCLDLNSTYMKLAVVDDNGLLQVFDLQNKNEVLFTATGAIAVSWNSEYDDMISYTTMPNTLNIKTGLLPSYQQKIPGVVVGFKGNRVYNLNNSLIDIVETPHSYALYRYVEKKDLDSAYRIARLGVTEGDWRMLGMHAMTQLRLDIAQMAFIHIRDMRFLELLNKLELEQQQGTLKEHSKGNGILMGEIMAYQGKYHEAARHFVKSGHEDRAIEMFCDLKMWSEAKKVCSNESHLKELILQQAHWAEDLQNFTEAAFLYQACGDTAKMITMMRMAGQVDKLMDICRSIPRHEVALIAECADYFKKHKATSYALEAYEKIGDIFSLISLHVEMENWRQAFALLERYPLYYREVYIPWAEWLVYNGKFEEALEAYQLAKWPKEAIRMMESLAANSVICRNYRDAAFYFIQLAREYGVVEDGRKLTDLELANRIKLSAECVRRADIYYAYHFVYSHATQPFLYNEVTLFNLSRYVVSMLGNSSVPLNVGKGEVLYTLARVSNHLNMPSVARAAFERLQSVVLPTKITEQVDVDSLLIRSNTSSDKEEIRDMCYRCKQVVQNLTKPGDRCPNCAHTFVRSFVNFEPLPLVEITLSNDLTDAEAERIILTGAGRKAKDVNDKKDGKSHCEWKSDAGADVITFADEEDNIDAMINYEMAALGRRSIGQQDPFQAQLMYATRPGKSNESYQPFVVNAEMLRQMQRDEIFIVKPGLGTLPVENKYYRVVSDNVSIVLCSGCQHFFKDTDYEYECMKGNGCPLCRHKTGRKQGRSMQKFFGDVVEGTNR